VHHAGEAAVDVRDHVDDAAAARVRDHPLIRDLAAHVKRAREVVLEHGEEAVRRDVLRRRRKLPACVVDEDVEPAESLDHLGHERGDLRRLADVARCREHAIGCAELGRSCGQLLGRAAADRDACAEREQLARGREADARATAGDDRDLIVEDAGREHALAVGGRCCVHRGADINGNPRAASAV